MAQTGPRSSNGKMIASLNNLKHGLTLTGILPCKKMRCFYIDLCLIKIVHGEEYIEKIPFGNPCPLEVANYHAIKQAYGAITPNHINNIEGVLHELALLLIRRERQRKYNSIIPALVRDVPGYIYNTSREVPSLGWRYRNDITPRLFKLLEGILLSGHVEC